MKKFFLRNDDVRGVLDDSLRYLTERALKQGICLLHAVEPANVTPEVAGWLLAVKKTHPDLIGIIQHGFDHRIKTAPPFRGEFGGRRPYAEQLDEIRRGAERMDQLFGAMWSRIFSFPFGSYDLNTLRALEQCGFQTISTGMQFSLKRKIFNAAGRILRMKAIHGRNIVYFNEGIPGFSLCEVPVVLNNTKKQTSPDTAVQRTAQELLSVWRALPGWLDVVGVLSHHRFNSRADIDELMDFFKKIQAEGATCCKLGDLARV